MGGPSVSMVSQYTSGKVGRQGLWAQMEADEQTWRQRLFVKYSQKFFQPQGMIQFFPIQFGQRISAAQLKCSYLVMPLILSHRSQITLGLAGSLSAEHSWSEDLARRTELVVQVTDFYTAGIQGEQFLLEEYMTGRFCKYILPYEKKTYKHKQRYQSAVWAMHRIQSLNKLRRRASHKRITSQKRVWKDYC